MSDEILSALCNIAEHVCKGDTVDETLARVVEFATVFLNCDECSTYVRQGRELVPWVWKNGKHGSLQETSIGVDGGLGAALSTYLEPIAISENATKDSAFRLFEEWSRNPGETFVCAPFMRRSQLLGAVSLRHLKPRAYSRREFNFVSAIGFILGADLDIARLDEENSNMVLELETRKLVERSKGILQRELGMSEQEAHSALQSQSQQKKRSMKDIAQAIILSAEVRQSVIQSE